MIQTLYSTRRARRHGKLARLKCGKATALSFVLTVLLAATAVELRAQRVELEPKRPNGSVADTNDASAYMDLARRSLTTNPGAAADAFYWASRLEPALSDALHGRRVALLLADNSLLRQVMTSNGRKQSKREQQLDSLMLRAVMLNPLIYRRFDLLLLKTYFQREIERANPGTSAPSASEIDFEINQYLRQAGPYTRGWMSYAGGDFKSALAGYADAMKSTKEKASIRIERGRIFAMTSQPDSAVAEFQGALAELRKRDAKDLVVLYNSKAVIEQSIGLMMERKDDLAAAREAYGRALQEDLSYWPAHFSLGLLAANAKDTTTALSEFALATDIAIDEPHVLATVGSALAQLGKPREAMVALKKAIAIDPYFALPYLVLGQQYEATNSPSEAVTAYQEFLVRASRGDGLRATAQARLTALKSGRSTK